jgi:Putative F0F1-ATPase subunit Ca2+/Mg2+ transporter
MVVCLAISMSDRVSLRRPVVSWSSGSREGEWPNSCVAPRHRLTRIETLVVEGKPSPGLMDLLSMGLASALAIAVGLVGGLLLDNWLRTSPLLTFVGLALGVAAAVLLTIRLARRSL